MSNSDNSANRCGGRGLYEVGFIPSPKDGLNYLHRDSEIYWDDKFGLIEKLEKNMTEGKKVIEGVGADAEIITNAAGGKQSKSPMAMHLIDPRYLQEVFGDLAEQCEYCDEGDSTVVDPKDMDRYSCYRAIINIAKFMQDGDKRYLFKALDYLESDAVQQVMTIAKVLQYGADRYEPNNWRLIPQEEHINHALVHIISHIAGDRQDDHRYHALCRLMMARATEKSEGFAYDHYVKKAS